MSIILGSTPLGTILMTLISFLLVIYIVYKFAWKPISKVIQEREDYVTKELQDAKKARQESQEDVETAKETVEKAMIQAQNIVQNAKQHSDEMSTKIVEKAQKEAEDIRTKANKDIQRQRKQFHQEMEESVVKISVMMAQKVLEREISQENHRQFIHEYIERLDAEVK